MYKIIKSLTHKLNYITIFIIKDLKLWLFVKFVIKK